VRCPSNSTRPALITTSPRSGSMASQRSPMTSERRSPHKVNLHAAAHSSRSANVRRPRQCVGWPVLNGLGRSRSAT
jgi:hypothetical protein